MAGETNMLSLLARLLKYPDAGSLRDLDQCRAIEAPSDAEHLVGLRAFASALDGQSVEALQELYAQTFDFDPACTLDVGWHLFGENYDRGDFLVVLRAELGRYKVNEDRELPDHLPHLVELLSRMEPDRAAELSARVAPALEKIRSGLQGKNSPFGHVLAAVCSEVSALAPAGGLHRG